MIEGIIDILLVEDNPHDVEWTLDALNIQNLANRVKVLKDGAEALDYIFMTGKYKEDDARKNPVLILLDMNLPKINGHEVLQRIRSDKRTKNIPIVVLTDSRDEGEKLKYYDLGANSYIEKPVEVPKFIKALGEVGFYWAVLNKAP
ncbi:MAG TPA: response regulator [Syntrophales bacterium]|nr:response regulator [Syntrophales bacterium]